MTSIDGFRAFVAERFEEHHGASPCTDYGDWQALNGPEGDPLAVLGFRCANKEPLFAEAYLTVPIETAVSGALGFPVMRDEIVEIGCLAAAPTPALFKLWHKAARHLAGSHAIAVATLTLPLRRMFDRVGMPFVELAAADPTRLAPELRDRWGTYYETMPMLCAGGIRAGLRALDGFGGAAR